MPGTRLAGRLRRVVTALLALALLALPGGPMRHAAAAAPVHAALAGDQADPCPGHAAAAPAAHHPGGGEPCDRDGTLPGLACCAAGLCAGPQGAPPPALAAPLSLPRAAPRLAAASPGHRGLDIPPALKPPRAA